MDEVGRRPGYRRQAGARSPRALPVREREMALATCSCWAAQRRAQPLDMSEAHEVTGSQTGRADSRHRRNKVTDCVDGSGVQRTAVRASSRTGVSVLAAQAWIAAERARALP